ncbi:MAG: response regulator, partial [Saprospiraceae bacterium]|nr:response regulator [Saprospiraceae bacterium]
AHTRELVRLMGGEIKVESEVGKGTRLIENNGKNLLRLANQLLDLSKLEDQSFQLELKQGDIVPFLSYVTESFQTYANSKNLSLRFFSNQESLMMDYDPVQIQQILTNLISNALKFTPSDGDVQVKLGVQSQQLQIGVEDTGIGIAEKDLPHVFDRFYQADNSTTRVGEGTGIGLAHTRELVRLMGGEIKVESEVGKGTRFLVSLPIHTKAEIIDTIAAPVEGSLLAASPEDMPVFGTHQQDLPQVLIIEDNRDVVIYLKSCLADQYQVQVAYNGKIGIEKALQQVPDLIISDVMMPEKDGYEVCDALKNDQRTSHVPIILLTAKADHPSKLTGLKRGADVYLIKPFDKEELLVRLEMLLERQQRMMAHFSKTFLGQARAEELDKEGVQIENAFLQKVKEVIENHYQDEDFALPQLCQKIGMSRSQLFRKMRALIGISPSAFIRDYRLDRAKILLQTTDQNVSEVAFAVGYKNLAHFSKSFQAKYGHSPSTTHK